MNSSNPWVVAILAMLRQNEEKNKRGNGALEIRKRALESTGKKKKYGVGLRAWRYKFNIMLGTSSNTRTVIRPSIRISMLS
jgi:hypothetical protein